MYVLYHFCNRSRFFKPYARKRIGRSIGGRRSDCARKLGAVRVPFVMPPYASFWLGLTGDARLSQVSCCRAIRVHFGVGRPVSP